jgi:hypothetical protein
MPKLTLAIFTVSCCLVWSNLTLAATATENRCRLTPVTVNSIALTAKKCGLKRVYVRPRHRR